MATLLHDAPPVNGRLAGPATHPAAARLTTDRPRIGVFHAPGFEAVNWFGTVFTFTRKQRVVVAALWQAWQQGYHWVDQAALLEDAESAQTRLGDLFDRGRHPAWGTMIRPAGGGEAPAGCYRLAMPDWLTPSGPSAG